MISLATVTINEKVRENVNACLDEERIGQGRFIEEFEQKVVDYVGTRYAIATASGTLADMVALAALRAKNPTKSEVIVPALTFIAHIQSVLANELVPVFVDVRPDYQMNSKLIERKITSNTLAVMPAHLLGKSCDIKGIQRVTQRYNLEIVEDCCETFGLKPKQLGTYSFFPSHTISTGEGGMIVTDDTELADLCRKMRNHGRKSDKILDKFHFDYYGFNGKISNIAAAIGTAVIDEADEIIRKRKENVRILNGTTGRHWDAQSPHCYPVMYDSRKERDRKLIELEENGIEARKIFSSLPTQEEVYRYLGYKLGDFPIAEEVGDKGLFVPIHQNLKDKDIQQIGLCIRKK